MNYDGQKIRCQSIENQIAELTFDAKEDSVNKFDRQTLAELREVVDLLQTDNSVKGLLLSSGKNVFIVGADITEFLGYFAAPKEEIVEWLKTANAIFSDLEDLNFPSVTAINGFALGGGFEVALATCYRVMSTNAKVGQPEIKLGIIPGFGGTVRLPRVIGADNAIEWIAAGKEYRADAAFQTGAVNAAVAPEKLREAALHMLKRAISGELDWKSKQQEKRAPLKLNQIEGLMVFEGAKAFITGQAGPNYPAPVKSVEVMQAGSTQERGKALEKEHAVFADLAKNPVAGNLVSLFLNDQLLKKIAKKFQKTATPIHSAAVLGAGIMGGGIAYQSASRGTPIVMKDINADAINAGLAEASKLLNKQVERGRLNSEKMAETLNKIRGTLSYEDIAGVDIVVEAVVENFKIKKTVLGEVEKLLEENTVLTSNTSTLSISKLAEDLKRPELFCGMHFFNPVHRMPLVEVIRGEKTSDRAIAQAVGYAVSMGKSPLVVNDCPGFLINRILAPYFAGFVNLLSKGVDFQRIDKLMEKFGWPMGPAYLLDVIGLDTAFHVEEVMSEGFPDRMKSEGKTPSGIMYDNKRFGQKNGKGFYAYTLDKKGKPKKSADPAALELLQPLVKEVVETTDDEIIEQMMLPMIIEGSRCLEEGIVDSPQEVDMGCIYGIGFPPFRGGLMKYADSIGLASLCEKAERYKSAGQLYQATEQIRALAKEGKGFYDRS
ncbi:MAG: fatty acid oxidation complex subunit alpha FadB [SAR324 cluster bacterium]|nr:fatty acid oxidation complex subunit alpha FadB [SAR324 cluster bacterium]